ncbi:MAG: ABC transporter ATP-binding protein [Clostridiales Family XIII bacterium]|jgi:peptide/nickel transport system ATP-binding protein|nr:ABC transporter ATP-binding protein [Clostridiales Family XIII bacterium]
MNALSVAGLNVYIRDHQILKNVNFAVESGSAVGIVGESGSGKTILAKSLIGLLPGGGRPEGEYRIGAEEVPLAASEKEWRKIRGKRIGLILQDPSTALEPLGKCGTQILEGVPKENRKAFDVAEALAEVGLSADVQHRYPNEISGGQRQRVVIAASLATEPELLIADEATTSLDVVTQKEILDLIDEIREKRKMPLIIISHDIGLVSDRTDYAVVMQEGEIVEEGPVAELIANPRTDYAKKLIEADRVLFTSDYREAPKDGSLVVVAESLKKSFEGAVALDEVSVEVRRGECVGIVGESGSGKTTFARCLVGLERPDSGTIEYTGKGHPQMIFQDPYSSLNPSHTIKYILLEAIRAAGYPQEESKKKLSEMLSLAELREELLSRKPDSLSGGQRQRVAIARALALESELLICDESVSALDVIVQNQILDTIEGLRREKGLAVLFITHDLSVARRIADRIYVMRGGRVLEHGTVRNIFEAPKEAYTKELLEAAFAAGHL